LDDFEDDSGEYNGAVYKSIYRAELARSRGQSRSFRKTTMITRKIFTVTLIVINLSITVSTTVAQGILKPSEWTALHNRDISGWEKKTGMSRGWMERILETTGRGGMDDPYLINNLDPVHLKNRGQVFLGLTDSGTAHALTVYVVDIGTPSFKKVWEAGGVPKVGACAPTDFATASKLGEPTASVTDNGQIVVKMPVNWHGQKSELLVAVFTWTGETYRLANEHRFSGYKWNGKDWEEVEKSDGRKCE
jgi:hypothetical protein